jgi:predicted nuclease with RNAse H fold
VRTFGVDLSADPAKTGACLIDWDACTVAFLRRPTGDEALVTAALDADMIGIDVPLGWPDDFVDALVAHGDGTGWPPVGLKPPADRVSLSYRTTDLVARSSGARPLSVSSDRIGVAAMRGARLQHLLVEAGVAVDRSGLSGRVIEAYPAAALRVWGLTHSKYKGTANAVACSTLAGEVAQRCGPLGAAVAARLDGCDDDGLDALICALIARAALDGNTTRPGPEQAEVAAREGWIHIPTVGLDRIVGGPS